MIQNNLLDNYKMSLAKKKKEKNEIPLL